MTPSVSTSNLSQNVAHSSWTTFPHKKEKDCVPLHVKSKVSGHGRMSLCGCAKISRSFLDGGHSLILVRTVPDSERKKVASNRQSFVSASCKKRIQTIARQVESACLFFVSDLLP